MEVDLGKLFIGGISWDTREDGLREYFSKFGEVVEAVIMKDRNTGRARGFGFIVFADPAVAERVVLEKHTIDGRMVEAKKAVPRDDQQILNRSSSSVPGSPVPSRTKKIFVGGLPSTLTESDFKNYFDQFGTITDVVVMYDHNTQRPRGFGFITYDSEDAVDKALVKTFHELNGKIVEVKRAVPKELSPGPSNRPPISGYNYGLNRINNFINGHTLGYNPGTISSFGMRMDGRLGPLASGRNGFTTVGPGLPISMDYEQNLNPSLAGNSGFNNNLNYGRALLNSYYSGNSSRFSSPNTYGSLNANSSSIFSSTARNLLGNTALNYATNASATNASATNASMTSESGGIVSFDSGSLNCGNSSSLISSQLGGSGSGYLSRNPAYGSGEYMGLGGRTFERRIAPSNYNINSASGYDGSYAKLYSNSVYGDPTWQSALSELDVTSPFGYRLDNSDIDITDKGFADYMTGYNMNNRQPDRGIVT